jgi:hypothetical protein
MHTPIDADLLRGVGLCILLVTCNRIYTGNIPSVRTVLPVRLA